LVMEASINTAIARFASSMRGGARKNSVQSGAV
jgi:hypothetical protein